MHRDILPATLWPILKYRRMYDKQQTPVFTSDDLRQLVEVFRRTVNSTEMAVYDVYPKRDQGEASTTG